MKLSKAEHQLTKAIVKSVGISISNLFPTWTDVIHATVRSFEAADNIDSLAKLISAVERPGSGANGNGGGSDYEQYIREEIQTFALSWAEVCVCLSRRLLSSNRPISVKLIQEVLIQCIESTEALFLRDSPLILYYPYYFHDCLLRGKHKSKFNQPLTPFQIFYNGIGPKDCDMRTYRLYEELVSGGRIDLFIVDPLRRTFLNSDQIELRPLAYNLLLFLAKRPPGTVFTYEEILQKVWKQQSEQFSSRKTIRDKILRVVNYDLKPKIESPRRSYPLLIVKRSIGLTLIDNAQVVLIVRRPGSVNLDFAFHSDPL